MDAAIIAVDSDTSTTTVTISRSMEVTSAPVIDVNVGPSLIDGTPTDTTVWRCWSSVASSGGSQRAQIMFLYHMGVCGTAGGAPIGVSEVSRELVFAVQVYLNVDGKGLKGSKRL